MIRGRRFPIIRSCYNDREFARELSNKCPASVPWSFVEDHEEQAQTNHYQTLERLAERGGLSPTELYYVAHDQVWPYGGQRITERAAMEWLIGLNLDKGE